MAEKNRSYNVRCRRGTLVRLLRPALACDWIAPGDYSRMIHIIVPAGTVLAVNSESNAGFRGIEFSAYYTADGRRYHLSLSTGAVEVV